MSVGGLYRGGSRPRAVQTLGATLGVRHARRQKD